MKNSWEVRKLGEVCEVITRGVSPKYVELDGLCVLNQKCIRDHRINFDLARIHDCKTKPVSNEKFIQIGDVLVNSTGTGTLGRVAQVRLTPVRSIVDSHITIVRPLKNRFYSDFFGYAMIYLEEEIAKKGEGCGGQTELARNTLKNELEFAYPKSLNEQRHIVVILDEAFDAIAKARENAEKNLQNARELFESYLHSIFANPGDGWEDRKLGDKMLLEIIDGDRGKNYPGKTDFSNEGFCLFMNTKNVRPDGFDFKNTMFINEEKDRALGKGKLKRNDVVMTTRGTIGNLGVYTDNIEYENIRINSGMLIFRPNHEEIIPEYLFQILRSNIVKSQINKHASGAAQPQLPIKTIVNFSIPVPKSIYEQKSIVARLDALSTDTKKLEAIYEQKLIDLEELKKSILEKAFKGELSGGES